MVGKTGIESRTPEMSGIAKMMKGALFAFLAMAAANALAADVPQVKGGACWATLSLKAAVGPDVVFACEHLGKVTVSQIYEKGFRVVAMTHNPAHPEFVSLVIEERR
jgi:hypothetical protein